MKSRVLSMLAIVAVFCCGIADAQVPHKLNYQGFLTSPSGAPINNAGLQMVFNIYNVATLGTPLHTETQTVTVSNGIFNVLLGTGAALTLPFDAQYYLGVTPGADPEMSPRQPLAASPYAIRAATAATADALNAGGTAGQVLAGTGGAPAWTGSPVLAGNLGVGSVNAAAARLDVSGSGWFRADADVFAASAAQGIRVFYDTFSGTGSVYAYDYAASNPLNLTLQSPGGNVGIGTAVPGSKLTVAGVIESAPGGGFKYPDGNTQTKALANCSAEGDVAVMRLGAWVCRSTLGYVDNGDGTVTDNKTGLMWEKKLASTDFACINPNQANRNVRCQQNVYTWSASSPLSEPTGTLYSDFLQQLDGLNLSGGVPCFAGYCDWRAPTQGELRSILTAQYPATCSSSLCINAIFGPTFAVGYWSSSSLAGNTLDAWVVRFNNGRVDAGGSKGNGYYARAVRSGR